MERRRLHLYAGDRRGQPGAVLCGAGISGRGGHCSPPNWAHCTIVADITQNLTFGAWCVRDYGFDYRGVRSHGGVAWFPVVRDQAIVFQKNPAYQTEECVIKRPRPYTELGIEQGKPIYTQFEEDPDRFLFVSHPQLVNWENFVP